MINEEKQYIDKFDELLKTKNYQELYKKQAPVIDQMLMIENEDEFDAFLAEDSLEDDVFWLHHSALHGESLLIGCYEGDVTEKVSDFLKRRLPENLFDIIKEDIREIYVDIDDTDNLEECIGTLNERLEEHNCSIQIYFDDLYCAGEYFLTVGGD